MSIPKLEEECGVTEISLRNAEKLLNFFGIPDHVVLNCEKEPYVGHEVIVEWGKRYRHVFTGFSWGYGGTGPNGLRKFCEMCGINFGMDKIMALDGNESLKIR